MSRVSFAQFVINTGDNFYETGILDEDSEKVKNSWYDVYNKNDLANIPWYGVLGNHDYKGNAEAQLDISKVSDDYKAWILEDRNYRVVKANVLFVFIDTTPLLESYRTDLSIAPNLEYRCFLLL